MDQHAEWSVVRGRGSRPVASERWLRNLDMSRIWNPVGRHTQVDRSRGPHRLKSLSHVLEEQLVVPGRPRLDAGTQPRRPTGDRTLGDGPTPFFHPWRRVKHAP